MKQCDKNVVRVFSDEIYEDIIFDGKKHLSIASIPGMEEYTIISSGFSKGLGWTGGIRIPLKQYLVSNLCLLFFLYLDYIISNFRTIRILDSSYSERS